jgi:hypothetical protein
MSRHEPDQKINVDQDVAARLARAEAEREKVQMLERHLNDVRRMLPAPENRPRRRWWSF